MGRSQESFNKKDVRNKKEKKRKEKEEKKMLRKSNEKSGSFEDMIAYVDENGMITSTPPDPTQKTEIEADQIQISTPKQDNTHKNDPIKRGTVSFFNTSKGFGFIAEESTKRDIFLHVSNLKEQVTEGDEVLFEIEMGLKGPTAINVRLANSASNASETEDPEKQS